MAPKYYLHRCQILDVAIVLAVEEGFERVSDEVFRRTLMLYDVALTAIVQDVAADYL